MRDRLIEILKKRGWLRYLITDTNIERLADILLENGVIVPPVKVGQTVYCIYCQWSNPSVSERKVRKIEFDGDCKIKDEMLCTWYECEIGHTVFLTREEAEQALAERNKDE